ncbi:unannotated protein [freshwater metagenome]|uniref:Unannotated protein n=1 Tax=freshwater metagenome TaxID=449393 RepID=A0A6J6GXQ1_9ZZZZ
MLRAVNDNWCQLVVSAVEERLDVEGFRVGQETAADTRAWEIWQANRLDEDSQIAHTEALKLGEAHAIVWRPQPDQMPVITIEHPMHVCVELDPANRSNRLAAVKAWRDEDEGQCATVYLPDGIYKLRRGKKGWEQREVPGEPYPIPNEWGVVPVVPIPNRPGLLDETVSEIENVLSKQDMINKLMADMIVAAEYGAFRQRWATGIEIPKGADGRETEDFASAVDRLWHVPAPDAKFGEFNQTDLGIYVKAIEMLVQHIASQTATPPHYLLSTGQMPSGESLRAAEAPLVAKARRKQRVFGGGWEEVMRLALRMDGRDLDGVQIATVWADPETRTESEHVDAVMKMQALGVPQEMLWELLRFTPQEIARFRQMRSADALNAALGAPAPSSGSGSAPGSDSGAAELRSKAEAMGVLIRAGADPDSAAEAVGLNGIEFTGAVPVSLRLPEAAATNLETV